MTTDLMDLLEELVGASELLEIESRSMMISSIQASCLSQRVPESLRTKDMIVGRKRIFPEPRRASLL